MCVVERRAAAMRRARSIVRSSMCARAVEHGLERGVHLGSVISVRNPRLPKFTPRIGTSRPASPMRAAMPSSVPSPPRTTTRSERRQVARLRRASPSARLSGRRASGACRFRTPARCRARAASRSQRRQARRRGVKAALGDDADAVESGRSCVGRGGGGTRGCLAPVAGDGVRPVRRQSYPSAAAVDFSHDARVDGRRPNDSALPTSSRPASNCGFTSATTSAPGRSSGGTRRQDVAAAR